MAGTKVFGSDVAKVKPRGAECFFCVDPGILLATYMEVAPLLGRTGSGMMTSQF